MDKRTFAVYDELVHATWAQGGPDGLDHHLAGVNVADDLRDSLRGVCSFLHQENSWLLRGIVLVDNRETVL